jgi:hypothetical protein
VPDLRNHPGLNFYQSGVPIVIAGDDPGSFGYNELTVDFYMIYMAWGLDLYDLKLLANNSIKYSLAGEDVRHVGFIKFTRAWNAFIDSVHSSVCNDYTTRTITISQLNVTDMMPAYGPNDISINVTLYGYGFEVAFCRQIKCRFGSVETSGFLHKYGQIRCATPVDGFEADEVADVAVQLDSVVLNTGFKYKFVDGRSIEIVDDEPAVGAPRIPTGNSNSSCYSVDLLFGFSFSFCSRGFSL